MIVIFGHLDSKLAGTKKKFTCFVQLLKIAFNRTYLSMTNPTTNTTYTCSVEENGEQGPKVHFSLSVLVYKQVYLMKKKTYRFSFV